MSTRIGIERENGERIIEPYTLYDGQRLPVPFRIDESSDKADGEIELYNFFAGNGVIVAIYSSSHTKIHGLMGEGSMDIKIGNSPERVILKIETSKSIVREEIPTPSIPFLP